MTERYAAFESINGESITLIVNLNEEGMLSRPQKYPYIHDILESRMRTMLEELREFSKVSWEAYEEALDKDLDAKLPNIPADIKQLTLHGFVYGGKYPGLPTAPECSHVGTDDGPFYAQDISFCVTGVTLNNERLPFMDGLTLAYSFHLPVVPVGIFGEHLEVLEWVKEHQNDNTQIPTKQPRLDVDGNPIKDGDGYATLPELTNNKVKGWVVVKAY